MQITQHMPAFVEGWTPRISRFASLAELLALDWIGSFRLAPGFYRFSLAGYGEKVLLMAEVDEGVSWQVVGSLDALPVWAPRRITPELPASHAKAAGLGD